MKSVTASRRAILAGLSTVAALAAGGSANLAAIAATRPAAILVPLASPPVASSADPIFAAIEGHKRAKAALCPAMEAFNTLDHKMIDARQKGMRAPNGWRAARDCWSDACAAEQEALRALALTIATSPEGAAAQVDYWTKNIGPTDEWDDDTTRDAMRLMTSLVSTINGLSGGAA